MNKKQILIVEDDPLISRMYAHKMEADGYDAVVAANGEEALAFIRKQKPDLIMLDVMMPRMNGVETLKALKSDVKTKNIPVIILTNLGDNPDDIKKAKELGALDYLVKAHVPLKKLAGIISEAIEVEPR